MCMYVYMYTCTYVHMYVYVCTVCDITNIIMHTYIISHYYYYTYVCVMYVYNTCINREVLGTNFAQYIHTYRYNVSMDIRTYIC